MFWNKRKFKLGVFPYHYKCTNCNHPETKMDHDAEADRFLKNSFGVKSDLPLFFQCVHCRTGIIRPIGYDGKPSYLVECEK